MSEVKPGPVIAPSAFEAPQEATSSPGFKWRWQHSAGVIVLVLVTLTLTFLLTARAVVISSNAENTALTLTGGPTLELGNGRYLLMRGEYSLQASAEGYHPFEQELFISADSPPTLNISLQPLPGRIRAFFAIEDPYGEDIEGIFRLNGTGIGPVRESLFRDLEVGEYSLNADAYLYAPTTMDVNVRGREITEEISLTLEPNWGYVDLEFEPSSAVLFAGSQQLNKVEAGYRIEAGTSKLRLEAEGYKPWEADIEILKDQALAINAVILEPVDSEIELVTQPVGASVTINGDYLGQTPLILDLLPEVEHQLQLFKAGYQPQSHRLSVERDARETFDYQLVADMVEVSLSVSPQQAKIFVNNVERGSGSQRLSLSSVVHDIRVEAPGYATQNLEFLPVRGSRQLLQVHLLTDEQALWANIPAEYTGAAGNDMLLFRDAGQVSMGSSRREPGRRANEVQWNARLDRPFYVSTTEITNSQYRLFEKEHTSGHYETMGLDGPERPAVSMSWQKAALFCNWLSEQSGLEPFYQTTKGFVSGVNAESTGYRLLTEAEWAYVAKITPAGIAQKYIWGDEDVFATPPENFADQSIANHINFTLANVNDDFPVSSPVASFPPNERGLHDLGGNVMEWVHDWYQPLPNDSNEEAVDPLGPEEGEFHVIRGASWARGYLPQLRLAYRDYDSKGRNDLGFRIARYAM